MAPNNGIKNRIWIELDSLIDPEDLINQCELANKMLEKLIGKTEDQFFWLKGEGYCYGGHNGYNTLPDRGMWFSLDKLSESQP